MTDYKIDAETGKIFEKPSNEQDVESVIAAALEAAQRIQEETLAKIELTFPTLNTTEYRAIMHTMLAVLFQAYPECWIVVPSEGKGPAYEDAVEVMGSTMIGSAERWVGKLGVAGTMALRAKLSKSVDEYFTKMGYDREKATKMLQAKMAEAGVIWTPEGE